MTVGTPSYAAPEQLMGEEIDGRADQYALAATAYHLLTGSQLFSHSNPAVVISRHLNASPRRCRSFAPIWPTWMRFWPKRCPRTPPTAMYGARISPAPWPAKPTHSPSPHRQHPQRKPKRCNEPPPLHPQRPDPLPRRRLRKGGVFPRQAEGRWTMMG